MAEARNLRNMTLQQTPLLGDENSSMHELVGRTGTGFEGATPAPSVQPTPNPLATPFRQPGDDTSATPRSVRGGQAGAPGATPLRTPRDSLAINTPSTVRGPGETPREQKHRMRQQLSSLEAGFAALPKPSNNFELVVPEDQMDDDDTMDTGPALSAEDAAERDARIAARKAEEKRKALARRSQVVKLGLPRPAEFDPSSLLYDLQNAQEGSAEQELERLIAMEMIRLLEHDSILYPVAGGSKAGGGKSQLEQVSDEALEKARNAVHVELATELGFPGASEAVVKRTLAAHLRDDIDNAFTAIWQPAMDSFVYNAQTGTYQDKESMSNQEIVQGQVALLENFKKRMTADATKAAKAEKKLSVTLGGYQGRSRALTAKLQQVTEELREAMLSLQSFSRLSQNEETAAPRRIEQLQLDVRKLLQIEREGQSKYEQLARDKNELTSRVEDLEMEYADAVNEAALAEMDAE